MIPRRTVRSERPVIVIRRGTLVYQDGSRHVLSFPPPKKKPLGLGLPPIVAARTAKGLLIQSKIYGTTYQLSTTCVEQYFMMSNRILAFFLAPPQSSFAHPRN